MLRRLTHMCVCIYTYIYMYIYIDQYDFSGHENANVCMLPASLLNFLSLLLFTYMCVYILYICFVTIIC